MNYMKKTARKSAALLLAAALTLCGCQESSVVENGDLPQTIDAQNDLTTTTTAETEPETTTTTTTTTEATTTEATTTTPEETSVPETQAPVTGLPTGTLPPATYEAGDEHDMYAVNPVNVRSGPGTGYAILGVLSSGAKVTIIGSSGDWSAINYNNTTGYILTSLLSNNPPAAAPAAVVTTIRQHVSGYRGGKNPDGSYPALKHDLDYMYKLNSDFIGWITIKDTPIDIPVVQAIDNKFYLDHDFYGRIDTTKVGVIFADSHVPVTADGGPQNLILYGHNIRTGVGFAKVSQYSPIYKGQSPNLNFYLGHPTIRYESIYGGQSTYVVFAGMFVNTETKDGAVFNYYKYRNFGSKNNFYQYFENVFDRSEFYNPAVDISYDDQFLTLSTCYYPIGIDTRYVLFTRQLRPGEDKNIDVSKAYINKSPLYFKYWYQTKGGEWAGRKWPQSLIKGYKEWLKETGQSS